MIDIGKGRYWDLPWSLVDGCTPCSPGCDHCWSAAMTKRFHPYAEIEGEMAFPLITDDGKWFNGRIRTRPDRLDVPMRRRRPTVFAVWNDLFHEAVPFEFIHWAFDTIRKTPQHTYLILTKRHQRMAEIVARIKRMETLGWANGFYSHVYFCLTICNQAEADKKIPIFLRVPGNKFLSIEPMLGPVDLGGILTKPQWGEPDEHNLRPLEIVGRNDLIDAVILGGETGPGARSMHPGWVRSVRDQCREAGVSFFFKGWGEWAPSCDYYDEDDELRDQCLDFPHILLTEDGYQWHVGGPRGRHDGQPPSGTSIMHRIGRKNHARLLDGRTHDDLPWERKEK